MASGEDEQATALADGWRDDEGYPVTLSYSVHVLNRLRGVVRKRDDWRRGSFNDEESDRRVELALLRAIDCIQADPRYLSGEFALSKDTTAVLDDVLRREGR